MLVDLEAGVVTVSSVLGGLEVSVLEATNVPVLVLGRFEDELTTVLLDDELAVSVSSSKLDITILLDGEVLARVSDGLQLDVNGLVSGVEAVNLPVSPLSITSIDIDVARVVSAQVLAAAVVGEGDHTTILPGESCHFDWSV